MIKSGTGFEDHSISNTIMKKLCSDSGGRALFENNIENGLRKLALHKFVFYHMNFPLYKKDKDLEIDLEDKFSLMRGYTYPKSLNNEYIDKIRMNLLKEKCNIKNFKVLEEKIYFTLQGFERNTENFGLLRVGIYISNKNGEKIYSEENTLRTSTKNENISLVIPIPGSVTGECCIEISVSDLIAKKGTFLERELIVKR